MKTKTRKACQSILQPIKLSPEPVTIAYVSGSTLAFSISTVMKMRSCTELKSQIKRQGEKVKCQSQEYNSDFQTSIQCWEIDNSIKD